jgi:hypothetical protein
MKTLLIVLVLATSGCFPKPDIIYVTNPIYRPERPKVPTIHDKELECLSPPEYFKQYGHVSEIYQKLVTKDQLMVEYIEKLENIIDSTRKGVENVDGVRDGK